MKSTHMKSSFSLSLINNWVIELIKFACRIHSWFQRDKWGSIRRRKIDRRLYYSGYQNIYNKCNNLNKLHQPTIWKPWSDYHSIIFFYFRNPKFEFFKLRITIFNMLSFSSFFFFLFRPPFVVDNNIINLMHIKYLTIFRSIDETWSFLLLNLGCCGSCFDLLYRFSSSIDTQQFVCSFKRTTRVFPQIDFVKINRKS